MYLIFQHVVIFGVENCKTAISPICHISALQILYQTKLAKNGHGTKEMLGDELRAPYNVK